MIIIMIIVFSIIVYRVEDVATASLLCFSKDGCHQ